MKRSKYTEQQAAYALRQAEAGTPVTRVTPEPYSPVGSGTPYRNGAFSPDGRNITYVMRGDLYVSPVSWRPERPGGDGSDTTVPVLMSGRGRMNP